MATFTYDEAIRYLCGDPALRADDEDRRDEARGVVTDAVWALTEEQGDGRQEMWDWIAEGDWSTSGLDQLAAYAADALATARAIRAGEA